MSQRLQNGLIQGVYAAAVTARRPTGYEIDVAAVLEAVDFLSSHGVDGITLMGATGEFVHFAPDERIKVVNLAIKRSRVPVLVNVSHSTLDGTLRLAQEAIDAGAAGLLVMPPYFYRYEQQEVANYFFRLYGELATKTPILLYNIPQFTSEIGAETAQALLASEFFAGIKVSSASWDYMERLLNQRFAQERPFSVMVGSDSLFARARACGAQGIISGVAAAVPELILALDRAVRANQIEKTEKLNAMLSEFLYWVEAFPAPVAIREAASVRGLNTGSLAVPLGTEMQQVLVRFREWFAQWLPGVVKESKP